ncbi:hypothetical protein SBRCBS47491_006246 [Sporothrix bragantina]|uniref:Heterokaryon incompatibility domain-containing protein n=1 Tax=Sporothrix bragantina TaxID=671064 RepID=A0ABP0C3A9_9PEZI
MNADQTQQGAEASPPPTENSASTMSDNTLPYHGKAVDSNSLRLLTIQPAAQKSDPVVCTLVEAAFGGRPKFNALSYTWGDSAPDDPTITLNGVPFEVRRNLFDALIFLRHQKDHAVEQFWIDAICINQNDVDERNCQVRIMDQIYFRATAVIVWLGQWYARFEEAEAAEPQGPLPPENRTKPNEEGEDDLGLASETNTVIRQRQLCSHLEVDPYWERVWILQEITKAWTLHVCFGTTSYMWDEFMDLLRQHTDRANDIQELSSPLKLHQALREKGRRGSHKLFDLLKEHKHAKCTDLHDKVYGLLGMATDGVGFPIDYGKSLYEVWMDTMVFLNEKKLLSVKDSFIYHGALVKNLLQIDGGDLGCLATTTARSQTATTATARQNGDTYPEQIDASQLIDITSQKRHVLDRLASPPELHCRAYYLHATVLGSVLRVGPSTQSIVAEPDVLTAWKSTIGQLYETDELDAAHWESDNLLRTLLETDDRKMAASCVSLPSTVLFPPETFPVNTRNAVGIPPPDTKTAQGETNPLALRDPKLYFLKAVTGITRNKTGVAASLVQAGDILCEISSLKLLVRVFREGPLSGKACVVGTALTTEDYMDLVSAIPPLRPAGLAQALLGALITLIAIDTVAVGLRMYVRTILNSSAFGVDDVLAAGGYVCYLVATVYAIKGCFYGLGTRDADLPSHLYQVRGTQLFIWWIISYIFSIPFIKSAIAAQIMRLTKSPSYRVPLWFVIGSSTGTSLAGLVAVLVHCKPVSATWTGEGVFLPFFLIRKLNMDARRKWSLIVILSVGICACIFNILRVPYLKHYIIPEDSLYFLGYIVLWSMLEEGVGMFAASLPSLRKLFANFYGSFNNPGQSVLRIRVGPKG